MAAIKIAVKKLDGIVKVEGDHEKGTATVSKASLPENPEKKKGDGAERRDQTDPSRSYAPDEKS